MRKLFNWLDENILTILAGFLLVFIPLYPKLPLFDIIPGYIVRVRLEDFFVSGTILVWIVWLLRGKVSLRGNPLVWPILLYLVVGLLSILSAIFVTQTVPQENLHIAKTVLHYLRRIEYFSLFFIFYSTVKSIRTIKIYVSLLLVVSLAVVIYGFGQKYLYWPVWSTMNREFSKGMVLYLTEYARVLSTFGGHYDLAAFVMMVLVLLWSLFFTFKKRFLKGLIFLLIAANFWILILTASRISFLAYILGVSVLFFFWIFHKGIMWTIPRWFIVIALSILVMLSFGDLSERYSKLLKINERVSRIRSFILSPRTNPPTERAIFLENNPRTALIAEIAAQSDKPPTLKRPVDVYADIPLLMTVASESGSVTAIPRTYSRNAFIFDLSTAIRLDALWPQAIKGFQRNIFLGSGYATLNKATPTDFTEAESTDNDYLRSLGETGILGFMTFFGTLTIMLILILRKLFRIHDHFIFGTSVALAAFIIGLLVNATLIDVFEASKVAFFFWGFSGVCLAGLNLVKGEKEKRIVPGIPDWHNFVMKLKIIPRRIIKSNLFVLTIILAIAFWVRLYKINTPLADWHSFRQADTSAVTRNYVKNGINILYPTYDDLSNIQSGKDNPKGLRFVEFPLYNLASVLVDNIVIGYNVEVSGRLTSIFATLGSIIFLFLLVEKYLGKKEAILTTFFFAILPYNIYFTRVILPEPFLVFTTLGMMYFLDRWIEKSLHFQWDVSSLREKGRIVILFFLVLLFTISSLLVKPFAAFLLLPFAYLWVRGFRISLLSIVGLFLFLGISILPLLWWRSWVNHFPEGTPAYLWLLNEDGIRFKGAFFYWIFAERLGKLILGYWGLPLFLLGVLSRPKKEGWLFYIWGISLLLYIAVFATGNVRHDYYQIITIPLIAIFLAKGVVFLLDLAGKSTSRFLTYIFIVVMILFTEMFGWYYVRDFYNINHPEIVEAGFAVEKNTSDKALVIAPYFGDTAFLYQTRRAGWPIMQESVDKMIDKGADYYVSVTFDTLTNELIADATNPDPKKRKFKIIEQTPKYVIIQLVPDQLLR